MNDEIASQMFAALGNPHRVALIRLIVRAGEEGLNVTSLRQKLGLPPSTLAHHLKILADAGLVVQERFGRDLVSRAAFKRIQSLDTFLTEDCCKDVFICCGRE